MALFGKEDVTGSAEAMAYRRRLIDEMVFEIIPMKSAEPAVEALPPKAAVSVTASPVKGLDATMELTDYIRAAGHRPVPHLSARLTDGPGHVARLARWLRSEGHDTIFVVAGDAEVAAGPYQGAIDFLRALFDHDSGVHRVGITSYPDGHPFIPTEVCDEQLIAKQELLAEVGVEGWASSQMCFDTDKLTSWLQRERDRGFTLPLHLGIPGVIDRTRLMTMGVRLGVGASLRYLKKNRAAVTRLMAPGHYDPDDILMPMVDQLEPLGVEGLHVFTFNQVASTENWRRQVLSEEVPS